MEKISLNHKILKIVAKNKKKTIKKIEKNKNGKEKIKELFGLSSFSRF